MDVLGIRMAPMTTREREEAIFTAFRDRYGLVGQFLHNKGDEPGDEEGKPDFTGHNDGAILGIEMTEIYVPWRMRGSTLREHEVTKQRIVDRACEKAGQFGLPLLHVSVIFTSVPVKGKEDDLAESLFEIVKAHCPGPDHPVHLNAESALPGDISEVFIRNWGDLLKEPYWEYIEAGIVETDFAGQLQEIMDGKARKLHRYLKYCDRCWLVIIAPGDRPSSFYVPTRQMGAMRYTSPFERVFFVNDALKISQELNVEKQAL